MDQNFKQAGKWWNSRDVDLIEKDGTIYALHGWNGESYTESWQVVGRTESVGKFDIRPVYEQVGDDQFEIVDYEVR